MQITKIKHQNNFVPRVCYYLLLLFIAIVFQFGACGPGRKPHEIKQRLVRAKFGYKAPPDTMEFSHGYSVSAIINKAQSKRYLLEYLDSLSEEFEGKYDVVSIKVSKVVRTVLLDPSGNKDFDIINLSTEAQYIDDSTSTTWNWNVTPRQSGEVKLLLRATISYNEASSPIPENKDVVIFDKKFYVHASFWPKVALFFVNYWQWIATALLFPTILATYKKIARWFRKRRRNR